VRAGNSLNVLLLTVDTLRPDHLGIYGYARPTSPRIDAFAREAVVFERAYTYWPKTRGSFVMMFTGRLPSQNGYSKKHPLILGFNTTLAEVLKGAGYVTAAVVDNPNVAAQYGYDKGFERYRETWMEPALATETDRSRAISDDGVAFLQAAPRDRPFFLWLHWVNPHAPYTPPPPYDTKFLDAAAASGTRLRPVEGFHGGVRREWAVPGRDRLGYYVAQYDGEIAAVDEQVGRVLDALRASGQAERTLVLLTSDHGESLGEHDYYFDHGENVFDPGLAIPLVMALPGGARGERTAALASTLDLVPTVLDAVKVSFPPDLAGRSLLPLLTGGAPPARERLFAQNERHLTAGFDARFKVVAAPGERGQAFALYDRSADPGETRDASRAQPDALRVGRREVELFLERAEREWTVTRGRAGDAPGEGRPTREACEQLRALGYIQNCP
jgi:arylsulfatase A-like enzyme